MSDIRFEFKGTVYTLPASRAFEACEALEEVATLQQTLRWLTDPQFGKLARCTNILLTMAGGKFTDAEVKAELLAAFRDMRHGAVTGAVMALHAVIFDGVPEPAKPKAEVLPGEGGAGKPDQDSPEPPI